MENIWFKIGVIILILILILILFDITYNIITGKYFTNWCMKKFCLNVPTWLYIPLLGTEYGYKLVYGIPFNKYLDEV